MPQTDGITPVEAVYRVGSLNPRETFNRFEPTAPPQASGCQAQIHLRLTELEARELRPQARQIKR